MAQIIRQPDGKYCMFSNVVDNVTAYNMVRDEIVSFLLEKQKTEIENQVDKIIHKIENGEKPYFQFTIRYEDMIEIIEAVHGIETVKEIKTLIEGDK